MRLFPIIKLHQKIPELSSGIFLMSQQVRRPNSVLSDYLSGLEIALWLKRTTSHEFSACNRIFVLFLFPGKIDVKNRMSNT